MPSPGSRSTSVVVLPHSCRTDAARLVAGERPVVAMVRACPEQARARAVRVLSTPVVAKLSLCACPSPVPRLNFFSSVAAVIFLRSWPPLRRGLARIRGTHGNVVLPSRVSRRRRARRCRVCDAIVA